MYKKFLFSLGIVFCSYASHMSPSHAMEAENFPDISHMSPPVTIRKTHEEDNKGLVHRAASWRSQDSSSSEESSADKADSAICDQYLVIIRKA
ncbi:MAG: hypothetical protein HYX35_06085 [Proteobacteria bacterium]|nr:hypothetical protein [Pseudomonadota bacterium]